jgi:hypothetical protein
MASKTSICKTGEKLLPNLLLRIEQHNLSSSQAGNLGVTFGSINLEAGDAVSISIIPDSALVQSHHLFPQMFLTGLSAFSFNLFLCTPHTVVGLTLVIQHGIPLSQPFNGLIHDDINPSSLIG